MEWVVVGCVAFFLFATVIVLAVIAGDSQKRQARETQKMQDKMCEMQGKQLEMQMEQVKSNSRLEGAINHLVTAVDGSTKVIGRLTSQVERTARSHLVLEKSTYKKTAQLYENDAEIVRAIRELQATMSALIYKGDNTLISFSPVPPTVRNPNQNESIDAPSS